MKNKILALSVLTLAFIFATNVYALSQSSNATTGVQAQQQTQTADQAEGNQIQMQDNEQVQAQGGSEVEVPVQNQNQIQNQGEESQIQNQLELAAPEQRRSQVANAVQEMLQVAEGNSGIGPQVKAIAQVQTQNQERLETSLQKVQSRSDLTKFFIGPNYKEINNAKEILIENRLRVLELNELKNQLSNEGEQQNLTQQAQVLEQVNLQVENSLNTSQKGFSLFGWLVKLFN